MKQFLPFSFLLFLSALTPSFAQKQKVMCTPPNVTMSSDVTICAGQSVTISATGSGTTAPYTYDWSPIASVSCSGSPACGTTTATPSGTQTYTCLVTDGVACTNTGTVTVTVNSLPTVGILGAAASICTGSSATLSGTGATSYSWSTSQVTNPIIVSPTTSTTYTVWGTDANSCSNTATATVNVNSLPSVSISGAASSICNGSTATLTGNGGTSYSWSTGAVTNPITVSPTTSTTYTVWGTDGNGCSNTSTATVNVNSLPAVSITGGAVSICAGNSATLTGNGGTSYSWSTGAVSNPITVSPTASTTYTVWGTDGNGCTNTATSTVDIFPAAVAGISGTTPICVGQTTTLTASGGTSFSWWNNGSASNPITDSPTTTTTYTVTATDGNSCTDNEVFTVTVNPLPVANAGSDVSVCSGSPTTLNGTGNGTYNWAPSSGLSSTTDANPTANPTITTTYTLTVTNSCGSIDDDVTITINTTPSVNAGSDVTICLNASTTLNASGSGTYNWAPSTGLSNTTIANPVANPTVSTNYTITITDVCGTADDSVWVYIDNPSASISGNSPICSGSSSTLCASGGGTYVWSSGPTTSCITVSPTSATGYTVTVTDGLGCTATDDITVNVNSLPAAAISGNSTICAGVNDTLVATGGVTYLWNTGATTDSLVVNPTTATNYTVTVTDGNGCSNTATISISVNPQPTANAGADVTICNGSSTTLTATGNGTYVWAPGGQTTTSITVSPTTGTTYTLSSTNSCGTAIDTVSVNVNSLPSATITGNATICSGSTDTLVATGGGTYIWSSGSTNDSIFVNPTSPTGYTVTVTGTNGCTNTGTFTVNASSVTAGITGTNAICAGQSATLTASGGTSYVWSTGGTTTSITVSPTTGTTYTVTASDVLGCTGTATFSVSVTAQPTASVTASTQTVCTGSSTTLNASGGTNYVWSPSTGLNNTTIANPIANPTTGITYTVIVSTGACSDTTSIAIGVNPVPTASLSATAGSICVGGCTSLSASGGATYVWSPSTGLSSTTGSVVNACPTSAVTYTVTTTDANGCTDDASTLINVLPPVSLILSGDTNVCAGSPTTLTAQGGGTYSWSNGSTASFIVVNPAVSTTYSVSSTNGACSDADSITVNVYALPSATATASPYTINIGGQTTLTGVISAGSYNWSPASPTLSCGTCQNPVANPTVTTTYTLTTTDVNGCTAVDTVVVNVTQECGDVFLPNAFSPNGDTYNDVFKVRNPCLNTMEFVIYNRWGQRVFETEDITMGWDGTKNGKDCDPAVFFYILNYDLITKPGEFKIQQGNVTLVR